jgi:hypothetical protein
VAAGDIVDPLTLNLEGEGGTILVGGHGLKIVP